MMKLGGWWRLWVVASVLLGVLAFFIARDVKDVSSFRYAMTEAEARAWVDEGKRRTHACDIMGHEAVEALGHDGQSDYQGSYSCTSDGQYISAFLWFFAPGAFLAAIGLTLRWIYRGFRRP